MRILIITQYFPPEIGAAAGRIGSLASYLSERTSVTVLAPVPSYPWGTIQRSCWKQKNPHSNGPKVVYTYKYPHRRNFLLRLYGELQYTLSSMIAAMKLPRHDLVLISSPSFFLGLIGLVLKWIRKVDYVLDVRDLYPASALDAGIIRKGLLYRLLKSMETALYRNALVVSVVLGAWVSNIKDVAKRIVVVPNGVDLIQFDIRKDTSIRELPGDRIKLLESHFVILFVGNLGLFYDFSPFISAARLLSSDEHADIQFIFLGEGTQKQELIEYVQSENITNCRFWDPVPNEIIPTILHQSNIGIVGIHPDAESIKGSIPNKVYEYLAGNLDVIACLHGELPNELVESGKFFNFSNSDVEGIIEKILEIKLMGKKEETRQELLQSMSRSTHFRKLWNEIQKATQADE